MVEVSDAAKLLDSENPNIDKTPLKVVEISCGIIENNKQTIWLLLNKELIDANIYVDIGTRMLPAENLKIYEKLLIISLPTLILPDSNDTELKKLITTYKLFLRSGSQQVELPVKFSPRFTSNHISHNNKVDSASQLSAIFEFSTGGEPMALIKPHVSLLRVCDDDGCNALHRAAGNRQSFALKTLLSVLRECETVQNTEEALNAKNSKGQTPLHCAVRAGDADCVHYLIRAGANRNIVDNEMNTISHYLSDVYNEAIYKEVLESTTSCCAEFDRNVDPVPENHLAQKNIDGYTPVHTAVRKLRLGLLEALIEANAPLDISDRNGETPLIAALVMDDTEAATILIEHNCDLNTVTTAGETPLKIACRKKNLLMIGRLLDAGATLESLGTGENRSEAADDEDVKRILNGDRIHVEDPEQTNANDDERANEAYSYESTSYSTNIDALDPHILDLYARDDVSCLNYLTRLRLAEILDENEKWVALANHLNCGHMVEFIRVCLDGNSSPTMILLDQYEQVPSAVLTTLTQCLEEMGETLCVRLIRTGNEQH